MRTVGRMPENNRQNGVEDQIDRSEDKLTRTVGWILMMRWIVTR